MKLQRSINGRLSCEQLFMADNIFIKNIYYMLAYAFQSLNETGFKSVEAEEFLNIHDLFASVLIKGVSGQIKRGLHRDYIDQTEPLANLRGKIDISSSVKQQTILTRRMICQYDLFSEDTQFNQILKTCMLLLLYHGNVKPENKKSLRKLLMYFCNIAEIAPNSINWSSIKYNKNSVTYKMLINICWLVIKGLLLTSKNGSFKMSQFLDDQKMHRLYEKFVLGYYKKEHPEIGVSASFIDWDIDDDSSMLLPVMKSDITLTKGSKTLIIDTKFYGHTLQTNSLFNSASIISGNLYQIYTYVKNKDRYRTGSVSGVLLYAKTDEQITPDNEYVVGGNKFGVKTFDLNVDFAEIRLQLDNLIKVYLC